MNNKVFIDTSMLVQYVKKAQGQLLERLIEDDNYNCFINETVVSEYYFYLIKLTTGKAPATVKASNRIEDIFYQQEEFKVIHLFDYLHNNSSLIKAVPLFMVKYNLLPNDAIILATCKLHGITKLASHDKDFIIPCIGEGIELLTEE